MAIAQEICVCGHTHTIRGSGIRRGEVRHSDLPCPLCSFVIERAVGRAKKSEWNLPPWTAREFPSKDLVVGKKFGYQIDGGSLGSGRVVHHIHCEVVRLEKIEAVMGVHRAYHSFGGKSEYDPRNSHGFVQEPAKINIVLRVEVQNDLNRKTSFSMELELNSQQVLNYSPTGTWD